MRRVKTLIIYILASLFISGPIHAQESQALVKRSVATVLFSSIGGAVLGLSTLSFTSEPEKHTKNIAYGAMMGALAGTAYLASKPNSGNYVDSYTKTELEQKEERRLVAQQSLQPKALLNLQFSF